MRSRAGRFTLMLLAVTALAAATYFYSTTQTEIGIVRDRAAAFDAGRLAALRHLFELRAAQQAYVAAGQNEAFWFDRATVSADALRGALTALRTPTLPAAARGPLDEADQALQEFASRDRRIRAYTSSGQRLLASDVIFSDGLEAVSRIVSALDRAAAAVSREDAAAVSRAVRRQQLTAAAAVAFAILVMLLLTPLRNLPAGEAPVAIQPERLEPDAPGLGLRRIELDDAPQIPARPSAPQPASERPAPIQTAPVQASVEMQDLAAVCTDLARLIDTSTMPAILERTAAALDASGLVVWVADRDAKELMPLAAHGYAAAVLSRMGTLPVDAENATAAAFRTSLVQTVTADAKSNGAIAAPLLSPSGCLGVMSVEVRSGGAKDPLRLAAAAIVAAQLATLVAPPVAQTEDRNTAVL
jgi:hypothetical protein